MKPLILIIAIVVSITSYGLNPSREYAALPSDFGMQYKEVSIKTDDNLLLQGWFFESPKPSPRLIIISDDGEGNMADNLELISYFLTLEYSVLSYDYRGFGKSDDFTINPNFFIYSQFVKDINAAIAFVRKNYTNITKIHLYGKGIGAGLSICAAVNQQLQRVIADCPYSSFEDIKIRIKEVENKDVLFPLGYNKNDMEPKFCLAEKGVGTKILFISADKDKIYNTKYIKTISEIRASNSTIYSVKNATFQNTLSVDKENYFNQIKLFLQQ